MTRIQFESSQTVKNALERILSENIRILSTAKPVIGPRQWSVTSSTAGKAYTVTQRDAMTLVCSCIAAERGNVCKHRVLVSQSIMQEAETLKASEQAAYDASLESMAARIAYNASYEASMDKASARIQRKASLRAKHA